MELKDLEVGDRARLTLEVELTAIDFDGELYFEGARGIEFGLYPQNNEAVISVELIEKPFKAGDIVRSKNGGVDHVLLKAGEGQDRFTYFADGQVRGVGHFPPEFYEVVASAEVGA